MLARLALLVVAVAFAGAVALISPGSGGQPEHAAASAAVATLADPLRYAEVSTAAPAPDALATSAAGTSYVPILVYHVVRPPYPTDSPAVRALAQTPEIFDAQMQHLASAGYHVVSLADLEASLASSTPLPVKSIILTFDDGWRDQFTYAFPILEKYHYPATFFVFTNAIGHRDFLTWDDLREMLAAGMTIGGHSRSHPYLTRITDDATLWDEIDGSKTLLEERLGVKVRDFAYPFGQENAAIEALVKRAGYASARGDYYYSGPQSLAKLYDLSALNAPTTEELFAKRFP